MTGKFFILMIALCGSQARPVWVEIPFIFDTSDEVGLSSWLVGGGGGRLGVKYSLLIFMTITAFSLESDKETTDIKAIFYGA